MTSQVKPGDRLPQVTLFDGAPNKPVRIDELCAGKSVVIVGVPGAFHADLPQQPPARLSDFDKLKAKGVDLVICVAVNDPFVMAAWAGALGSGDKVLMLADSRAEFAKAPGHGHRSDSRSCSVRCRRFSMHVVDNVVKSVNAEEDSSKVDASSSCRLLTKI
uniref:Peroxiredoxin-5 n=1 Tax=Macrostomum lignano TaxID=282301 RepID=A0A1I8IZF4_9PLAT